MIHIVKNKNGKFEVIETGKNGQFLSTSLQQYERRTGCWTNIKARMKNFGNSGVHVQDDTAKGGPAMYFISPVGKPYTAEGIQCGAPFTRKEK